MIYQCYINTDIKLKVSIQLKFQIENFPPSDLRAQLKKFTNM